MSASNRRTVIGLILTAMACVMAISSASAEELWQHSLDSAAALGTRIETDDTVKAEGDGSVRITTLWPTVINLAEVEGIEIQDATLVYQARLRAEDLEGSAYLEMWVHLPDSGPYFSRGLDSIVTGTTDWTERQTIFLLQKGQAPKTITLNLVVNGHGTVWIDEIRLLKQPLP